MTPAPVASIAPRVGRRQDVALKPAIHVEVEELLAPDHAGQRLAQDVVVLCAGLGQQLVIEHRGFGFTFGEDHLAPVEGLVSGSEESVMPMVAVWPGSTVSTCNAANLVPSRAGLTAA